MRQALLLPLLLVILASAAPSVACRAAEKPLFTSKMTIQAVLSAPIKQIYKQRKMDVRQYFEGTFSYKNDDGSNQKLAVKVRTRGIYRRLNCTRPPLRLNFAQKQNDGTLFERQNKLKLVGPCENAKSYQEYVALEYLAYQIWEEVSDYHFKTRLIHLNYIDEDGKIKPRDNITFVIEDIKDVAKRLELKEVKLKNAGRPQMNLQQTALVELFQLLIGNTDYSTLIGKPDERCCHNIRLISHEGEAADIIPIPYDFDVSGLVNPPYATPATQYPITKVRQRYFSGWCKEDRHFRSAIERFNERKPRVYAATQTMDQLSDFTRKKTLAYLDKFYAQINDEARVKREIIGRCRGKVIKG